MIVLALAVWNRPQYLREALASWNVAIDNYGRQLTIAIRVEPDSYECWDIIQKWDNPLLTKHVTVNPHTYGVSSNPWTAIDEAFNLQGDPVLYADDDIIVSPDVLHYVDWAHGMFRDDQSILGIATYSGRDLGFDIAGAHLSPHFKALVWATWPDRWYGRPNTPSLRDTWDHDYSTAQDLGGPKVWGHMKSGYDWNIMLRIMGSRQMIFPDVSRAQHIGREGGTHCTPSMFAEHLAPNFNDSDIVKDFHLHDVDWASL